MAESGGVAPNVGRKILRNTVSTFLSRLVLLGVGLLLTPYLLVRLGDEGYGVWVLLSAAVGFIGLADLGLGTSFVKFVAEYEARQDRKGLNGVYSTGLAVYLSLTAVVMAISEPVTRWALGFFRIAPDIEAEAHFVFMLGILSFLAANVGNVYESVINGRQRMDLSNRVVVAVTLLYAAGAVVALELGFGLRGLAVNQLASRLASIASMAVVAFRLDPALRFEPGAIAGYGGTLARYGLNLQVSRLAELINFHFDKFLVNRFLGAAPVTTYDIGSRLPSTARSFPAMLLSVLTPVAAELEARKDREETYRLFLSASRYVAAAAFALFAGLIVTADSLIEAWIGSGYGASVVVMRILCLGLVFNIAAGAVSPLVQGLGRVDFQRNTQILSLSLNVVFSIVLMQRYGFYGAPVGTAIALVISSSYYLWSFHRFMGRPVTAFVQSILVKPAVAAALAAVPSLVLSSVLMARASGNAWAALSVFLLTGGIFALVYGGLLLQWRYIDLGAIAQYRNAG